MMARLFTGATGNVFLLLSLMYFFMYVDRVALSAAAPAIQRELAIGNTELGLAFSAFGISYALLQIINGYLGDRFGPRKVLAMLGVFWTLGTFATALAGGLGTLIFSRIVLGLGEAGTIATATRAMSRWVPETCRGFAQGFTHAAARLAAAATPVLVVAAMAVMGWRGAFVALGAVSLAWTIAWFGYFRDDPRHHRGITPEALADLPRGEAANERREVPWRLLLPRILPTAMVFFCHAWALWLYLTWLPSFFVSEYHLDIKHSAMFTSGVFAAGVVGDTAGGLLTDWLLKRTGNVNAARRNTVILAYSGSFAFMALIFLVRDPVSIALVLAASLFFLEMCEGPIWAVPMDVAPHHAGIAGACLSTAAGLAGFLSPAAFGFVADLTGSFLPPFLMSLALLALGVALAFFMRPDIGLAERSVPATTAEIGA